MDDSARDMTPEDREAAHKAFRRAVAFSGSQSALARAIGQNQQNISNWMKWRWACPAYVVEAVEAATGVSRHDLRPDLYPREDAPVVQAVSPTAEAGS